MNKKKMTKNKIKSNILNKIVHLFPFLIVKK